MAEIKSADRVAAEQPRNPNIGAKDFSNAGPANKTIKGGVPVHPVNDHTVKDTGPHRGDKARMQRAIPVQPPKAG